MPETDPTNLVTFFGRLHPLVVHLPIGFLVVLAALEVVRWFKRFRGAAEARTVVLALLVLSSIAAVVFGLMLAEEGGYNADLLFWHKWMGIGLAVGCIATAVAFWSKSRWLYALFLLVTLGLLVPSTHFGGSMTHGSDYVIAYAPKWVRTLAGEKPTTRPLVVVNAAANVSPTTQPASADNAVVFTTVVQPVLAKYCVACHSAEKTKGELRLDTFEAIMKGGESGHIVVAGKSKESPLVERITLPLDHDDHMPPDGKPQPTIEQIALLKWWVDAGAPADKTVQQLAPPAETANLIAAALGVAPGGVAPGSLAGSSVAPTSQPVVSTEPAPLDSLSGEIAKLTTSLGIVIEPVAIEQPWLAINAAPAKAFGDAELTQLKPLALNIAVLNIAGTKVTDEGLAALASMPNLQRLRLERTGVTDDGMKHLSKLSKLNYLNLYGTPITDAGLKPLEALPALQQVYLWRTKVDADAAKAFAAAMTDQQKIDQLKTQIALLQSQIKAETVEVVQG
ncbi:MAG: c-type cytochrome domain-containing protein, partial [Tepidisphaeraceae bacterium]